MRRAINTKAAIPARYKITPMIAASTIPVVIPTDKQIAPGSIQITSTQTKNRNPKIYRSGLLVNSENIIPIDDS